MTATTDPPVEDAELELLHQRDYAVRVFRRNDHELLARGTMRDEKPAGMYVDDDREPLTIHDMTVELVVEYPTLVILDADVSFGTFPQPGCPGIADSYRQLVGISIARGFTHKVRELFGGPRGCTHVTALLQAMAPAVVQSTWSMRHFDRRGGDGPIPVDTFRARNVDTCHVWAAEGLWVGAAARGEVVGPGLPVRRRLVELGRDPGEWWAASQ
jgi:hypothetical protein